MLREPATVLNSACLLCVFCECSFVRCIELTCLWGRWCHELFLLTIQANCLGMLIKSLILVTYFGKGNKRPSENKFLLGALKNTCRAIEGVALRNVNFIISFK